MSHVAGILLLVMESPAAAFRAFANLLCSSKVLSSLYRLRSSDVSSTISLFQCTLDTHLPRLSAHFARLRVSLDYFLFEWLLTMFSQATPFIFTLRVVDCFIFEGDVFLIRTALGLLSYLQDKLLASSFEECLKTLRSSLASADPEELLAAVWKVKLHELPRMTIGRGGGGGGRSRKTSRAGEGAGEVGERGRGGAGRAVVEGEGGPGGRVTATPALATRRQTAARQAARLAAAGPTHSDLQQQQARRHPGADPHAVTDEESGDEFNSASDLPLSSLALSPAFPQFLHRPAHTQPGLAAALLIEDYQQAGSAPISDVSLGLGTVQDRAQAEPQ
jgi:hypothetical protein